MDVPGTACAGEPASAVEPQQTEGGVTLGTVNSLDEGSV